MSAIAVWEELPWPGDSSGSVVGRLRIVVDRSAWEHIVERHVMSGGEPWGDLFAPAIVAAIRRERPSDSAEAGGHVAAALARLADEARASLARPLVLQYQSAAGESGSELSENWLMVFPCGAVAAVRRRDRTFFLTTCYFPRAAVVEPRADRRWRRAVRHLVLRYWVVGPGLEHVAPPPCSAVFPVPREGPAREWRSDVRFVTLEAWGFDPKVKGSPWRGRLGAWPAAEGASGVGAGLSGRRRRIKRPRPIWDEE